MTWRRAGIRAVLAATTAATACVARCAGAQEPNRTPAANLPEASSPPMGDALVGDAKKDYEDAKALYRSGDYAGALARFQRAARAAQDPRLDWNAAACEAALTRYAAAGRLMRRYLDSRSPVITPAARRTAQDFLDETRTRTARLDVDSNEPEASVSIDDETIGAVPLPSDTRVDLGEHRIRVTKDGYADCATTIIVASTADVHLAATLLPVARYGRLVVRAGRRDAIAVDGTPVAIQVWTGALAVGAHQIRVTAQGSLPFEAAVTLEENQTRSIDVGPLAPARRDTGVPGWIWIAGGALLAAGAATAGYLALRPTEANTGHTIDGSVGTARLPLR